MLNPARADGFTALHFAAEQGHFDVCEYLIKYLDGEDKNPKDKYGRTPMHLAAYFGELEIVKCIMDKLEDKNPKNLDGQTPMHLAVQEGDYEMCKVIINHGADPNPTDNEGITALDLADSNQEI